MGNKNRLIVYFLWVLNKLKLIAVFMLNAENMKPYDNFLQEMSYCIRRFIVVLYEFLKQQSLMLKVWNSGLLKFQ